MKRPVVVAAVVVLGLIAVVAYVAHKLSSNAPSMMTVPAESADSIPTPQYLFEHPDTLKVAEQKCSSDGNPSSLYCSNVHKAESLRLADKYRRSSQPNGADK